MKRLQKCAQSVIIYRKGCPFTFRPNPNIVRPSHLLAYRPEGAQSTTQGMALLFIPYMEFKAMCLAHAIHIAHYEVPYDLPYNFCIIWYASIH